MIVAVNAIYATAKPERSVKKIQDFNGVWNRNLAIPVRCSTNWAMKPLTLGAGQLWVHIWFISYIINTHFFQGNIWTHNWPSANVSGFIAQLVEHRTGIASTRVQTPLKSWIFFFFLGFLRNCINCVHCDDHFLFNSFPQFIYDLFHISLTNIFLSTVSV